MSQRKWEVKTRLMASSYSDCVGQDYSWPEVPSVLNPIVAAHYSDLKVQFELFDGKRSSLKCE